VKLETEFECNIAGVTLQILESKLIAIVKSNEFDEMSFMFGERKTAPSAILKLFDAAAALARVDLGLPPKINRDGPGMIQ
jgi:hypothetical protein